MSNKPDGKIYSLKDFGKSLIEEGKPSEATIQTTEELEKKGVLIETKKQVETPKKEVKAPVVNISDAQDVNSASRALMEEMKMQEARYKKTGIMKEFSKEEAEQMKKAAQGAAGEFLSYTKGEAEEYTKLLIEKGGYTQEEINNIPYMTLLSIGRNFKKDLEEGKAGELAHVIKEDGSIDEAAVHNVPERIVEKIDSTKEVTSAVSGMVKEETPKETKKEEIKEKEEEVKNDVSVKEKTLTELLGETENVYIKYVDKPMNSFKRLKMNKQRKLLERQKRGNMVEVFLPNSNMKLQVYELHQPAIINEILTVEAMSQSIMAKRKTIETILERSTPLCADGSEITLEAMLHYISQDDIPYIYAAAAAANDIDGVPYNVQCETCGTRGSITLKVKPLFVKAMQDIPLEIISGFNSGDNFVQCVEKSNANKVIEVHDKEARVTVTLTNPSIATHLGVAEAIKVYLCETFANSIPQELQYRTLDAKFDFLLSLGNPEVFKVIASCIILAYVDEIKMYNFDDSKPNIPWNDESKLDETFSGADDTMDTLVECMASLEKTTIDIIQKATEENFINCRIEMETGDWKCANTKCNAINNTRVEGLELLILSLQHSMQTNR